MFRRLGFAAGLSAAGCFRSPALADREWTGRFRAWNGPKRHAETRSKLRAFTLVELLVSIAIIGGLIGLLLPAIQSAREASRRMQCANNLKQIGIGILNYESAFRRLPVGGAGVASTTNAVARARWRPSWGSVILPFIEQQPLFDSLDLNYSYLDAVNQSGGSQLVPTYLCPSAPKANLRKPNGDTMNSSILYGRTDYGGNYGERSLRCFPASNCQNNYSEIGDSSGVGRGVMLFGHERQIGLVEITDGASNTVAIGEAPEGLHSIWIGHKNVFDQSSPINAQVETVSRWASCAPFLKSLQGNFCDYGQEFHSYHAGGSLFLFVDGSARLLDESITPQTLSAILSRRGGEIVSDL